MIKLLIINIVAIILIACSTSDIISSSKPIDNSNQLIGQWCDDEMCLIFTTDTMTIEGAYAPATRYDMHKYKVDGDKILHYYYTVYCEFEIDRDTLHVYNSYTTLDHYLIKKY